MNVWLIIAVIGLVSLLFRLSMVAVIDRVTVPEPMARATELVAPAAFAALAATGIATVCTGVAAPHLVPPLAAVVVAVAAVLRTGSPHAATLAGMPTLWVLSAAVGA